MQPQRCRNGEPLSTIRAKAGASWTEEFDRQARSPNPVERLAVYNAIRALACLPSEAGFYLVGYTIEQIADEQIEQSIVVGPLKAISDRMDVLKRARGLEVDQDWPTGGEPDDWLALLTAFQEGVQRIRASMFRNLADPEMAELFLNDHPEFRRRMEVGRRYFFGPPR
jgi:hypothetical protein